MGMRKIYLVGPHSSGKTTLAEALKSYMNERSSSDKIPIPVTVMTEVARKVLKDKGYTRKDLYDPVSCYAMQRDILLAQFAEEKDRVFNPNANDVVIFDRCAVDPIAYNWMYCPEQGRLDSFPEWAQLRALYQNADKCRMFLLEPNPKFLKDDGTRMIPPDLEEWLRFYNVYKSFLELNNIPFLVIPAQLEDLEARVHFVLSQCQIAL